MVSHRRYRWPRSWRLSSHATSSVGTHATGTRGAGTHATEPHTTEPHTTEPRATGTRAAGTRGRLLQFADLIVLAICGLGLVAAWLVYGAGSGGHHERPPEEASAVISDEEGQGLPAPTATALATPSGKTAAPVAPPRPAYAPVHISYPAADFDVVVHPLKPSSGDKKSQTIVPPETMDAYWLTPFGKLGPGSVNTTYVFGHSWEGLDAPFNHLSTAAAPGQEFTVTTSAGVLKYKVDSVTTYTKSALKDSAIWSVVPNRLVLISCYTGDLWGKNVAVVASPVPRR